MLRKVLLILIEVTLCAFTFAASAESSDYASMSFEDLNALKQAVDKEYYSRPEAGPFQLPVDRYVIGETLDAGTYYVAMTVPSSTSFLSVVALYESYEAGEKHGWLFTGNEKWAYNLYLNDDPVMISVENENVLCIANAPAYISRTPFDPKEIYSYEPPKGTTVPAGRYTIGQEIPVGSYRVYPADPKLGEYQVRRPRIVDGEEKIDAINAPETTNKLRVYTEPESTVVNLQENDVLVVTKDIVMVKSHPLSFD